MKKTITLLSITFSLCATTLQAQTKTASKLGTSSKLSHNDSLMCGKKWQIISVEEFGVKDKPAEKNQNDLLMMTLDGKYNAILFGNKKAGTWNRSGQYIYFDDASGQKFSYKVISVEPKIIKIDFQNSDKTHSVFEMETK